MGLFNFLLKPKKPTLRDEMDKLLFPGGAQEYLIKSNVVVQLSNGKLNLAEAGETSWQVKYLIFTKVRTYDGQKNRGLNGEEFIQTIVNNSKDRLTRSEAAGIILYHIVNKIELETEAERILKQHCDVIYGSDSWGCDLDEIPGGFGEFGFEPSNPIPVRGIASVTIYFGGLRTQNGHPVEHKRTGSFDVPNIAGKVDEYNLSQNGVVS
jgi:hypothetical protein